MKKKLVQLAVLVSMLVLNGPWAGAFSLVGPETLPVDRNGLRIGMGYPSIYAAYHIPITSNFEVAPKFSFFYGWDTDIVLGNKVGAEFRYNFLKQDDFALGLTFDTAAVFVYDPEFAFGIQIGGPGILASYEFQRDSYLIGGMRVPFGFFPDQMEGVWATIPILFVLGGEFKLSPDLNLFALLELGPDILALDYDGPLEDDDSDVQFSPNFHIGISYLF